MYGELKKAVIPYFKLTSEAEKNHDKVKKSVCCYQNSI
jgi:hypothetical protein